jgi:hypothetical protein
MQTAEELSKSCATIIWVASALHAAVNFGQYPYCGYVPSRPSVSRKPMPVPGSKEYAELECNPEKVFLRTITSQFQALVGLSLLEILSSHSSDEVYLGQRDTPEWTSDAKAQEAFMRFGTRLTEIEKRVMTMNADPRLKNRNGPAKFPYTLLYPQHLSSRSQRMRHAPLHGSRKWFHLLVCCVIGVESTTIIFSLPVVKFCFQIPDTTHLAGLPFGFDRLLRVNHL